MQAFVPPQRSRVLEVGCAEGRFSASLTGVDETWGIEPTIAVQHARARMTKVLQGIFDQVATDLPLGYFDLVVCDDVIEHMPNHACFLASIRKYIRPKGMLIGSIPNVRYYENMMRFLLKKDRMYADYGILDQTHMALFTAKSLRRTLDHSGFRVERLTGINPKQGFSGPSRDKVYLVAAHVAAKATMGYFDDVQYLQFAFQAMPAAP